MTTVAQANSTVDAIRLKVRRLTASASQSALTTDDIDKAINTFYSQDFPYAIKLDQTRSVYTFFTQKDIDKYPLDVNYNQGIRSPVYFEGVKGFFFKDREQFYNMWPRWPTQFQPIAGDGVTKIFNFTLAGGFPFLSTMVVMGGIDANGAPIKVVDDGGRNTYQGNLLYIQTNNVGNQIPPTPNTSPIPPAIPLPSNTIGTVNYITGQFSINFPVAPAAGTLVTVWVSQYNNGRPYSLLFWNNQFEVRPVPDNVYKIEVESYLTPMQFIASTDNPVLTQWWQYLAYGASCEILRERQDMEGVQNLMEGMKRQEGLVLERQATEEIGQRNTTIFSQTNEQPSWGTPQGWQ